MPYKDKDKAKAYKKAYTKSHPEMVKKQKAAWRKNNPTEAKLAAFKRHLRNTYNISYSDFENMLHAQGGVCAICKTNPEPNRRLSVDHNHLTGKVRALLCGLCNYGLGAFKDDTLRLSKAIEYLEYHKNVSS